MFVRHITVRTSESDILEKFSRFVDPETIERIKKIQDYAFVHFTTRSDAEKAMRKMKCCFLDGSMLELKWARPADKLYTKNIHRESKTSNLSKELNLKINNEYLTQEKINTKSVDSHESNNYVDTYATSSPDILEDYCKRFVRFIYFLIRNVFGKRNGCHA